MNLKPNNINQNQRYMSTNNNQLSKKRIEFIARKNHMQFMLRLDILKKELTISKRKINSIPFSNPELILTVLDQIELALNVISNNATLNLSQLSNDNS